MRTTKLSLDSQRMLSAVALSAVTLASTASASMSRKERGAVIGAAAGGAAGGVVGKNTGSTARGAIIGAVVGRVHSSGRGELEPVGSNETDAGRQLNRRIEVAIFSGATR